MNQDLKKIIEHENANWSNIFKKDLEKKNAESFSSFWWEDYYKEITNFVNQIISKNNFKTVLESGSGSGKATILIGKHLDKTLLDISPVALEYARYLADKFSAENIKYVEGDMFSMPFEDNYSDFVWNIGVIEHYNLEDVRSIIREMIRVCSKPGIVAVGIPNFYSGPILRAKLSGFIPGYKLDTEKFYNPNEIKSLFLEVSSELGRKIDYIKVEYFGNPLIMETPKFVLKTLGVLISRIFRKNKFLILTICKFK